MPEPGGGGSATGNPFLDLLIVAAADRLQRLLRRLRVLPDHGQAVSAGAAVERGQSGPLSAAERLLEDPSRFLATIQVALTFLGFLASAVGAVRSPDPMACLIRLIPVGTDPGRSADDRVPPDHAPHRARHHRGRRAGAEDPGADLLRALCAHVLPADRLHGARAAAPSYGSSRWSPGCSSARWAARSDRRPATCRPRS